jgi:glycosyltransferase involved in cell wall biosynthesis
MRIIAAHLFNDFSGSPKVLMQLIKGWLAHDFDVEVYTCGGREGFLSDIPGAKKFNYWYKLASNPYIRFVFLFISQMLLFFKLVFKIGKSDIIYVNTVLPFGAALAGKLRGAKVIYHIHETSLKPLIFKKLMFALVKLCAAKVIYVSQYLAAEEPIKSVEQHILYNAIPDDFLKEASNNQRLHQELRNVLMVCSLKDYKGVKEFVELARMNDHFHFRLILNASETEKSNYFKNIVIPINCEIYTTQTNLHPHYQWADIILNLSRPDGWIETFGLTIIEGMAYGLPAIIPPIGGITELVEDAVNGYQVDSRKRIQLCEALSTIMSNTNTYNAMSAAAQLKLMQFTEAQFIESSLAILKC